MKYHRRKHITDRNRENRRHDSGWHLVFTGIVQWHRSYLFWMQKTDKRLKEYIGRPLLYCYNEKGS